MSKDKIEDAIKEVNEAADKAIEEVTETKMEVMAWLKQTHSFTYAELLVVALGVVVIVATAGNI
jgi:hypothetical protein